MHQITSNIFGSVPIVQKYTIFLYLQKNGFQKTTKNPSFCAKLLTVERRISHFLFINHIYRFAINVCLYVLNALRHKSLSRLGCCPRYVRSDVGILAANKRMVF